MKLIISTKIIRIIILLLLTFHVNAQNNPEASDSLRKKNNINKKLTYKINLDTNDSLLISENLYNKEGKQISSTNYDENGKTKRRSSSNYDTKDVVLTTEYDEFNSIISSSLSEYDTKGNRTSYKKFGLNGKLFYHLTTEYNDRLETKSFIKLEDEKDFFLTKEFFYNNRGFLIKTKDYRSKKDYASGGLITEFEYDNNGNLVKVYSSVRGNKNLLRANSYNSKKLIVKTIFYHRNTEVYYQYDDENNLVEEKTFQDGNPRIILRHHYIKFY